MAVAKNQIEELAKVFAELVKPNQMLVKRLKQIEA